MESSRQAVRIRSLVYPPGSGTNAGVISESESAPLGSGETFK